MRLAFISAGLALSVVAFAQDAPKPADALTVDQIVAKSIDAVGGADAIKKTTSLVMTGTMEIVAMGGTASAEHYAKAPNKAYTIINVDGYGEVKNGYDGTVGWSSEPQNGLVELKGERLAAAKRQATLDLDLHWKDFFTKAELGGKDKVGDNECLVVKFIPAEGTPETHCYDSKTFLLTKVLMTADTQQGPAEIQVEFSDYKDIGNGLKTPYTTKMTMPGIGDLITKYKDVKVNVDIDDAKFAKPKS
jgi:hypothetical protein